IVPILGVTSSLRLFLLFCPGESACKAAQEVQCSAPRIKELPYFPPELSAFSEIALIIAFFPKEKPREIPWLSGLIF
ncbi:hypothetical protein, partial [Lactobacillus equicursoris]|uniref:hypothetical protein n=1 Tax=Lactobacillus equicursoris TaxID=420645 RepID=UPI001F3B6FB1